jgi:hypothetical protein
MCWYVIEKKEEENVRLYFIEVFLPFFKIISSMDQQ